MGLLFVMPQVLRFVGKFGLGKEMTTYKIEQIEEQNEGQQRQINMLVDKTDQLKDDLKAESRARNTAASELASNLESESRVLREETKEKTNFLVRSINSANVRIDREKEEREMGDEKLSGRITKFANKWLKRFLDFELVTISGERKTLNLERKTADLETESRDHTAAIAANGAAIADTAAAAAANTATLGNIGAAFGH